MERIRKILSILMVAVIAFGVFLYSDKIVSLFPRSDKGSEGSDEKSEESFEGVSDADGSVSSELQTFNDLFNPQNRIEIFLDINERELLKIQADYEKYSEFGSKSPIYRMADMYITIYKLNGEKDVFFVEQVGVRMKGNTSRTSFYNSSLGMYNLVHFKISFCETFDNEEYYGNEAIVWMDSFSRNERKNRTFATLEKLDMRWNRNDDPTYIREIYAYDFYRSCGVLAPRANLASVDIGEDHVGVWTIYEAIDEAFLEKNLPSDALGGDLYKLGWTREGATLTSFKSFGVEDEDGGIFYNYDLKTNKKTSDHSSLEKLINALNSNFLNKNLFSELVDVNGFLLYCAASYIIGNPDDWRNNYNNTYIYFRADTGRMIIIPYDMDRGFGVNTWNPYGNGMTDDSPFQNYNVCGEQQNPIFNKTILEGGFLFSEYVEALRRIESSILLSNDVFVERFNIAKSLYENKTTPSKEYDNAQKHKFSFDVNKTCKADRNSNMSFKDYVSAKKKTLKKYIDSIGSESSTESKTPEYKSDSQFEMYLMADFNNWSKADSYRMTNVSEGVFKLEINVNQPIRFKLYDERENEWYGGENISADCPDVYEVENRPTNIVLGGGRYNIFFYTRPRTIYIEKK